MTLFASLRGRPLFIGTAQIAVGDRQLDRILRSLDPIEAALSEIFELLGLEILVESYGALPVTGILVSVMLGGYLLMRADLTTLLVSIPRFFVRSLTAPFRLVIRRLSNPGGTVEQKRNRTTVPDGDRSSSLSSLDDETLSEAIRRLHERAGEVTGPAIREEVEAIQEEITSESKHADKDSVELISDAHERSVADTMAVAPEQITEEGSYLIRNDQYVRILFVASYPGRVRFGWLDELFMRNINVRVSYHITPRDSQSMLARLGIRAARVLGKIQRKEEQSKYNTIEEETRLKNINRLRDRLAEGVTKAYDFGLYLEIIADSLEQLDSDTAEIEQVLAESNCRIVPLHDRQRRGQIAIAPLAHDNIRGTQVMDTESLGTTFPFIEPSVVHPTGVLFGFQRSTGTPVIVDRFSNALSGQNCLVSGKIGSGKSYFAKLFTWRRLMIDPEVEALIIDPVGASGDGFNEFVRALGGQVITVDGTTTINPLEIRAPTEEDQHSGKAFARKIDSVLGMCRSSFRGDFSDQEASILMRAIRFAYLRNGITDDPTTHDNESPVMQDVLDILKQMAMGRNPRDFLEVPEELENFISAIEMSTDTSGAAVSEQESQFIQRNREKEAAYAQAVRLGLEDFQEGGKNSYLNGQTTVDINARVVQFDVSAAVDGGNDPLLMHVVLDWLFQRMKASDRPNMVVVDEAHYMLRQQGALDTLELVARHSRHYNAGLTLISQTVDEFLRNDQTKTIYAQCDLRALMRHEELSIDACETLGLSMDERNAILTAKPGKGGEYSESLLYVSGVGNVRLKIFSSPYEDAILSNERNPWAFLYEGGYLPWSAIPSASQEDAWSYLTDDSRREIYETYVENTP